MEYLQKKSKRFPTIYSNQAKRYSVSDIVGCNRKAYCKQLGMPDEQLLGDATAENLCDSVRGDLLHQITYAYKWPELRFTPIMLFS